MPKTFRGSQEDHKSLLRLTMDLIPIIASYSLLHRSSMPVLWHTDLHMGNIFVSEQDPSVIVSLIDWQSSSISPMFLQARWPVFLEPPKNYIRGLNLPKLPENFGSLGCEDKEIAIREKEQASRAKAYEVSTFRQNKIVSNCLRVPQRIRELFLRCGDTCDDGIIPLRECLIGISREWSELGFTGTCPFSFTDEELGRHESEWEAYCQWHEIQGVARKALDTDADGWISPEVDWTAKKAQNKALYALFMDRLALEKPSADPTEMWPFPIQD